MYDRPPALYRRASIQETHNLFLKSNFGLNQQGQLHGETAFTKMEGNNIEFKKERPILLVSSTSWTADEDFDILIDLMIKLDSIIRESNLKLHVRLVVTGIGDLRQFYEKKFEELKLEYIEMYTGFFSYDDYSNKDRVGSIPKTYRGKFQLTSMG